MKAKHFILTSLAVLSGFASCQLGSENEEPTPQPQPQPSIVDTWTYHDVTCEVEAADSLTANIAKGLFYVAKLSIDSGTVEFEDNGLYHLYLSASALGKANPLNYTDIYTYEDSLLELGGVETPCTLTDTLLTLVCPLTEMAGDLGIPLDMSGIDRMDITLLLDRIP